MLINDEREFEYYDWEKEFGREEAIRIASEEWGMSTYQVEMLVKRWEDSYGCKLYTRPSRVHC